MLETLRSYESYFMTGVENTESWADRPKTLACRPCIVTETHMRNQQIIDERVYTCMNAKHLSLVVGGEFDLCVWLYLNLVHNRQPHSGLGMLIQCHLFDDTHVVIHIHL